MPLETPERRMSTRKSKPSHIALRANANPPTTPSSSTSRRKRSRDYNDDQQPTKIPKVLQFHPDTDDNGVWATGRRLEKPVPAKLRRQPTPFIHGDGALYIAGFIPTGDGRHFFKPSSDSDPSDDDDEPSSSRRVRTPRTRNPPSPTIDFRSRRGVLPSNLNGFATSIPYPVNSIVMTDGNGFSYAWQVTPDIFEDVGVYLRVRCMNHRVPEAANAERYPTSSAVQADAEQETTA